MIPWRYDAHHWLKYLYLFIQFSEWTNDSVHCYSELHCYLCTEYCSLRSPNYPFQCFETDGCTRNNAALCVDPLAFCEIMWMILACWSTSDPHVNNTGPFCFLCHWRGSALVLLSRAHSDENSAPPVHRVLCLGAFKRRLRPHLLLLCFDIMCRAPALAPQQLLPARPTGRRCQDALESISFSHFNYSWG